MGTNDNDFDDSLLNREINILNDEKYPGIKEIKEFFNKNNKDFTIIKDLQSSIKKININDTIGYRTLEEIFYYISKYTNTDVNNLDLNDKFFIQALDYQIAQKILPKLKVYSLNKEDKKEAFEAI
jgi:hypothetical protein